jgi:hypothetical protein
VDEKATHLICSRAQQVIPSENFVLATESFRNLAKELTTSTAVLLPTLADD